MKEATSTAAMVVPEMETMEEEEEERYVKVESRFFRVKARGGGGGGTAAGSRRLHYLEHCFLCKGSIAGNRDVFMHKDAAFCSDDCREEQMDMDEALHAVARRHRLLLTRAPAASSSSSSSPAAEAAPAVRRRPTIANLAARNPPVAAS